MELFSVSLIQIFPVHLVRYIRYELVQAAHFRFKPILQLDIKGLLNMV